MGYCVIIYIFSKIKRPSPVPKAGTDLPEVTLLIAAYNEETFIAEKIRNTLALDYPKNRLRIMFVTDGSTDRTPEIVAEYQSTVHGPQSTVKAAGTMDIAVANGPSIQLFHEAERRGKIHAVNRVMKLVTTPIVIFCDANTYLNPESLRLIVRHYADPRVGGVAGEKRIFKKEEDNASGAGEGIYWKYESFLKRKDSEVYSIVGAAGELFSLRTALFEEPPADTIIEDFYISLRIAARGYRFMYEPGAYATETASASVGEEWKRKVRICAGGFQAMSRLTPLLNPFRYGMLSFQYISHRVLRWTLAPLALPLIAISNIILAVYAGPFYQAILLAQSGFYALALLGYLVRDKTITIKGFFVPYYFAVMNLAVYAGFRRYLKGTQSVVWDKSKRAAVVPNSTFHPQTSGPKSGTT